MRPSPFARPLLLPILFVALGACAAVPSSGDASRDVVADGSDFSLQPGATVTLADHSHLRYLRLVAYSRCQPDVRCIWAGDAEVAFQWTQAGGTAEDFTLHTGKGQKERELGERRLALVSLSRGPAPSAGLRIERATPP